MSYQVLARKWRPSNFEEMVGQAHVLRALSSALDNERLHHAYLFTGTRGVGKTTIARILARCLNCDEGVSSKPCGVCSSCTEISEGRFVDLIEVDAASKTKIDDTRELLENVQYRPTRGRYKVYLIDEVHMLSNHSFNALLKTLEEPPPHVVFLLATTDPQKLPATVLSRCLQFHLKNMQPNDISQHLSFILDAENIEFESTALESISWSAKGSMRDALSLLDQAIAYGNGKVLESEVREMLGSIDREEIYQLLNALSDNDGAKCMAIIEKMSQFAPDYSDVLAELLAVLHRVAIYQQIPDSSSAHQDQHQIEQLAEQLSAEDIQLFYQLAMHGRRDLSLAPDTRNGFEMSVLRMMSFRPKINTEAPPVKKFESSSKDSAVAELKASLESNISNNVNAPAAQSRENTGSDKEVVIKNEGVNKAIINNEIDKLPKVDYKVVKSSDEANNPPLVEPVVQYSSSSLQSPLLRNKTEQKADVPDVEIVENSEIPKNTNEFKQSKRPESTPATVEPIQKTQSEESTNLHIEEPNPQLLADVESVHSLPTLESINVNNWHAVIGTMSITGVTQQIALNSQIISVTNECFEISLTNNIRTMLTNEHVNKITAAFNHIYQSTATLLVSDTEPSFETPRLRRERKQQERHDMACNNLNSDPQVQNMVKIFDAKLDYESVESLIETEVQNNVTAETNKATNETIDETIGN